MTEERAHLTFGAIALVGSGEYLPVMDSTDIHLLETLGGPEKTTIALLPTASGLEAHGPSSWNTLGLKHFQELGVKEIRSTQIIDRESASDPEQLELLQGANFYYFSGGNPQHLIETLQGTPAWQHIHSAYQQGAILAGCSAGAMAMGGWSVTPRALLANKLPELLPALQIEPRLITFPHFDRFANIINEVTFSNVLASLPEGCVALGIDENTALVRLEGHNGDAPVTGARWRVMGQQTVRIFNGMREPQVLRVGEEVLI